MPKPDDDLTSPRYMSLPLLVELRRLIAEHLPADLYELHRLQEADGDDPTGQTRADLAELKPRAAAFEGYYINSEGEQGFSLSATHHGVDTMQPTLLPSLSAVVMAIRERVTPPPTPERAVAA